MLNIVPVNDARLRMGEFTLSQSFYGTVIERTPTAVSFNMTGIFTDLPAGMVNRFIGVDLAYDDASGSFSGTVTGFEHITNGVVDFRLTDLNISAADLASRASNNRGADGVGGFLFSGGDSFTGSSGVDSILGYGGNDTISAGAGNDVISGESPSFYSRDIRGSQGNSHDVVYGGDGADYIFGGGGNDHLYGFGAVAGPDGNDTIDGSEGSDYIQGNGGDDVLEGGDGSDRIQGGSGNDIIRGDASLSEAERYAGNDTINGNRGDDTISGGGGNDVIRGGQGYDSLTGGTGYNLLFGDLGDDTLDGSQGISILTGGDGADIFSFGGGGGQSFVNAAHITDFQVGVDKILLAASRPPTSVVVIGYAEDEAQLQTLIQNQARKNVRPEDTIFVGYHLDGAFIYKPGNSLVVLDKFNAENLSLNDFIV